MNELRFEGYSDDTFGELTTGIDHDNCANGRPMLFKVCSGDEGLIVHGQYNNLTWPNSAPGCWMIGVQQLEEDVPLPAWPMRFETGKSGYTPTLIIEAPDDVEIKYLYGSKDE